ncbi:MAG: hypothetical protein IT338_15345 [Thermomicrobiales bacterium]|nr:hypothetical protein [Thermomicrobiales bacterium]
MKRLIIAALGLGLCLGGVGVIEARAQNGPYVYDDASGTDGASCTASGPSDGQVVLCKDLRPGRGVTVVNPGAQPAPATTKREPTPKAAPDAEPAPESTGTAAAEGDLDGDNYPDAVEPDLGLDPKNPDTDGDNVADGDEINIYGTDPLNPDTDNDGRSDGEELFATHTDPLVWDDFSTDAATAP